VFGGEPGYIAYERRHGRPIVLEMVDTPRPANSRAYIIVCGLSGTNTMMIRWYGQNVNDVRQSFRAWLQQPWQRTRETDLAGNPVPNGVDFKPSSISWFNIAPDS
jgi:hypothetical protein